MLVDLHAHYPMHVVSDVSPKSALDAMRAIAGQPTIKDRVRALVLRIASRLFNDENLYTGYRISVPQLTRGAGRRRAVGALPPVRGDGSQRAVRGAPRPEYFQGLLADLAKVRDDVAANDPAVIRIVTTEAELDHCVANDITALVHCVEGGFHLGDTDDEIRQNVATLADEGIAYITVAHLFFREVGDRTHRRSPSCATASTTVLFSAEGGRTG